MRGSLRFRRSLRRRDAVVITVFPGDGRITEDYELEQRELVRFAWGVLADFVPDEAAQAAKESGIRLEDALAEGQSDRQGRKRISSAPLKIGGEHHQLLARIAAEAPVALAQLEREPRDLTSNPRNLVKTLALKGLVQRVTEGAQGRPSSLALTVAGARALADLSERVAEARAA